MKYFRIGLCVFVVCLIILGGPLIVAPALVFGGLLLACIRYSKNEEAKRLGPKGRLICACKTGSLVKYDGLPEINGIRCIGNDGARKYVKDVYKCNNCGKLTLEID